jgi:CelD/BcsL family acetyltransferase involved in cellulose biosynthesis
MLTGIATAEDERVTLETVELEEFEALADRWEALVGERDGPFVTAAWLTAWWRAFARDDGLALALMDGERLLAGGCFRESRGGAGLASATNAHSGDWDVVAVDAEAAQRLWAELLGLHRHRDLRLDAIPGDHGHGDALRGAAAATGYRTIEEEQPPSPWMDLPASLEELLKGRSRNLRSQVGRRTRALESEGTVALRTTKGGPDLERDLGRFFELEASGWKGEIGTAIALDPSLEALYRDFATAAAKAGRLRLYFLELDGEPIAADYGCVHGGCGYLVKTGFREDLGRFAPGLVLRAEVLRASIEEGLSRYDFLGGPDGYKTRWTDDLRERSTLRAFRGVRGLPAYTWWASLRPALKSARELARGRTRVAR